MRGYSMGAVDYVFKPVDPIILRSKVSVFVDLFMMTREVQRKAQHEQKLLDESLRLNAERLRTEQELRLVEQRAGGDHPVAADRVSIWRNWVAPRACLASSAAISTAVTGFEYAALQENPNLWAERLHPDDRDKAVTTLMNRRTGRGWSVEYRWLCGDGRYKHFPRSGRAAARQGEQAAGIRRHADGRHRSP